MGDSSSKSWKDSLRAEEEEKGWSRAVVWGYPESWRKLVLLFCLWKNRGSNAPPHEEQLSSARRSASQLWRRGKGGKHSESHVKSPYHDVQRCLQLQHRTSWHIIFLLSWRPKVNLEVIAEAWLRSYDFFFVCVCACHWCVLSLPLLRVMWNVPETTPRRQNIGQRQHRRHKKNKNTHSWGVRDIILKASTAW